MLRNKFLLLIFILLNSILVRGYNPTTITGKVINNQTQKPIANCNVLILGTQIATQTNDLGEFTLQTETLPVDLIFAHLNFNKQIFRFKESHDNIINLTPIDGSNSNNALMQLDIAGDPFIKQLTEDIKNSNSTKTFKKIYIQTNKDTYSSGENIEYNGYIILGASYKYSLQDKMLHIEIVNSKNDIVISHTEKVYQGKSKGSINIPNEFATGNYEIRAYIKSLCSSDGRLFFKKKINIFNKNLIDDSGKSLTIDNKIRLQFFPEGGNIVESINGVVAFKARGNDGLGKNIRARILNSKGELVTVINSINQGAGFFNLKPKPEETYFAVLNDGSKYDLPKAKTSDYVLNLASIDDRNIGVRVDASTIYKNKPFYVVGTINRQKYFQGKFEFKGDEPIIFEIPKTILISGVLTLKLYDENGNQRNERIVFVDNQDYLKINTKINRSRFKKGRGVIKINVQDKYGNPLETSLSLTVNDAFESKKGFYSSNIISSLYLESELEDFIHNPGIYFVKRPRSAMSKSQVDLLMLTSTPHKHKCNDDTFNRIHQSINENSITKTEEFKKRRKRKNKQHKFKINMYSNHEIRVNRRGKAKVILNNIGDVDQVQIDIQGLSDEGIPGAYLKTFNKKK